VDLLHRYSNRTDLLDELTAIQRRLKQERRTPPCGESVSVSNIPPPRKWRVRDRLTPADIAHLIEDYHAGSILRELAERYSISTGSIKRLLRERKARLKDRRNNAA